MFFFFLLKFFRFCRIGHGSLSCFYFEEILGCINIFLVKTESFLDNFLDCWWFNRFWRSWDFLLRYWVFIESNLRCFIWRLQRFKRLLLLKLCLLYKFFSYPIDFNIWNGSLSFKLNLVLFVNLIKVNFILRFILWFCILLWFCFSFLSFFLLKLLFNLFCCCRLNNCW